MIFKFSTNFLLPYARKPAKYGGCGSPGLDATPTVQIHTGRPVLSMSKTNGIVLIQYQFTSKAFSLKPIFFDKTKLILDTAGLGKNTRSHYM